MKYLKTILLALCVTAFSYSQDLSQAKGGGVLDIVLISPGEGYSVMNFEGQISGYGSVFVKFKVASINTSKTSGTLDGQGRTILEDGTLISTPLKGTWKRNGKSMKFYFTDAINNGAKILKSRLNNRGIPTNGSTIQKIKHVPQTAVLAH